AVLGTNDAHQRDRLGSFARRVVAAREEAPEPAALVDHGLAAPGALLFGRDDLLFHRRDDAVLLDEVHRVLAVGIARAREEASVAAPLDDHGVAGFLAHE